MNARLNLDRFKAAGLPGAERSTEDVMSSVTTLTVSPCLQARDWGRSRSHEYAITRGPGLLQHFSKWSVLAAGALRGRLWPRPSRLQHSQILGLSSTRRLRRQSSDADYRRS
jgi:hypothetical protein